MLKIMEKRLKPAGPISQDSPGSEDRIKDIEKNAIGKSFLSRLPQQRSPIHRRAGKI